MMESVFEDASLILRPTTVEVDLSALQHNIQAVRSVVGKSAIMATVKANAYGHGLIRTSKEMLRFGVDELGVAFLEEGIVLRKSKVTAPILVLGGIIGNQISHFLEFDLQITASSVFKLRQIEECASTFGSKAHVHLKIDTGMGRIGIRPENAHLLFEAAAASPHIEIMGVFSHLATAHSTDKNFTQEQLSRFLESVQYFPNHSLPMPRLHIANSGAILQHPGAILDMVRPGIMLYGVYPDQEVRKSIELKPVLSFKTRVVYFKVAVKGTPIGYDHTWLAEKHTRIITLPVGYGDGYFRALSNNGDVLIGGERHPIVGRISMDQCTVDIGDASAYNGDEVVLIGRQGNECITVEEIAARVGTIPYEVLTNINTRVPRKYIG